MSDKASLTVRLDTPSNNRWSGTFPIEVRDSEKFVLKAKGLSDGILEVPPGRYLVTAVLPNGQQATAEEVVELRAGEDRQLDLSVSNLEFPAILQIPTASFGDTVKDFIRPVTQYFSSNNVEVIHGNWLGNRITPAGAAAHLVREPTTRSSLEVPFQDLPVWIEIEGSDGYGYLAVPVDEQRSTTVQWTIDSRTGNCETKFDFHDGELNSFYDFIRNDKSLEARSISHSLIAQSERFMMEKTRSPLRAILGAYVLLRANELEEMDVWTGNLVSMCAWLPDALAVRVEYLARNGRHRDALAALLQIETWGVPWFRSGVGYLAERAKLYANVALKNPNELPTGGDDLNKLQRIASVLTELAASLDMAQYVSMLRRLPRVT